MVVNAPDSPVQAQVIFAIEATAANGAYINELKSNYIIPTLEYFHGGALEEAGGNGSVYCIVTYRSADCIPSLPIATYGPFHTPQNILDAVEKIQFYGGHAESKACLTEAMTTALACFEELGRSETASHVLILCCSPPYSAYAGGLAPPGVPATVEGAARLLGERGVQVSVAAARRVPALHALFEHAGGEFHAAMQRNYAKDPRHLVLLRGYSLKERPPSPAPPPAPDIQTDVYGQRGGAVPPRPMSTVPNPSVGPPVGGPVGQVAFPRAGCGVRGNWLGPPRQPLYATNSALLTQLAQPSHPPPSHHPIQPGHPRMPGMVTPQQPSTSAPPGAVPPGAPGTPAGLQRSYIWSGVIEWMEKGKSPGEQQKTTKHLPCQVSASTKDIEPELKVDTWPNKLLMQLMPKQLISSIGGQYLKDSKSVLFHLQPSEALDALTKVMVNGFAGCVHFSPMSSPPQCDIKVLILLYTPDKKAYLGFIPNNQATFVDRLRKVIQQQKISQMINKQMPAVSSSGGMAPNMPQSTMAGSSGMSSGGMGGGMSSGMGQMGPNQGMGQPQMQQQQHQGMMISGGMQGQGMQGQSMQGQGMQGQGMQGQGMQGQGMQGQGMQGQSIQGQGMQGQVGGGKGPRANQLDGLEAARQENLHKIQQLQQTLDAAHQQEAQFKSQMDIMGHLQAAQQQELHYKQLEEQQRKHQLQQQLQQQLRNSGVGVGGHPPRVMRPLLPSNPGLRHLLQQQPQYRPGGTAARPPSQTQPFDDVNNYDFL